jgi:hypothetical protein
MTAVGLLVAGLAGYQIASSMDDLRFSKPSRPF